MQLYECSKFLLYGVVDCSGVIQILASAGSVLKNHSEQGGLVLKDVESTELYAEHLQMPLLVIFAYQMCLQEESDASHAYGLANVRRGQEFECECRTEWPKINPVLLRGWFHGMLGPII